MPKRKCVNRPERIAENAKYHFSEFYQKGDFKKVKQAGIFVYEITSPFGKHTGIVAHTDLQEFISKNIKPHEKTLKDKEKFSKNLLVERGAVVKPVLVSHPPSGDLSKLIYEHQDNHAPLLTIRLSENEDVHRIWPIFDASTIKQFQHFFGLVDHAYIADGHHKSKVLQQLNKNSKNHSLDVKRVLTAYFDFDAVKILDYNRMIEINEKLSLSDFHKQLAKKFNVKQKKKAFKPTNSHCLSMCLDGKWYELKWKPEILKKYQQHDVILDHHVFDHEVLNKILKIKNIKKNKTVGYFSGEKSPAEIGGRLANQPRMAAFFIYPVEIEQMVKLTEKDTTLPPKSTYFVPRLYNGIFCDDLRK